MPGRALKLKLVSEADAPEPVRQVFTEIKESVGVPYAGLLFRAYAAVPAFLELFWREVRPAVAHAEFFSLAERLRASAYTRIYTYFGVPDFCARTEQLNLSSGAREELTETVTLLHYYCGLQLLLGAAVLQAFDKKVGRALKQEESAAHPTFTARPVLVEDDTATPRVSRIYDEARRALGAPIVSTDFRAFARFPDFLEEYWTTLKAAYDSPMHAESQFGVEDAALSLAREFPAELDFSKPRLEEAGLSDDDIASTVRTTELLVKVQSDALLNITIAKIGVEGGTEKQVGPAASPENSATPEQRPKAA